MKEELTGYWKKTTDAITDALNSKAGQDIVGEIFAKAHNEGYLTKENEKEFKQQLFLFVFNNLIKEYPEINSKLAMDIYNELRGVRYENPVYV